uniref:Uncharacterized protein n=1 Tax=Solibacter usitatus (strain Ellin6076) TaxID=234267 RepID=Q01UT2_SOLUE
MRANWAYMNTKLRETLPVTQEWLAELSPDRYRPMSRLLDNRDIRFLREQQGFRPEMEKRLRSQRVLVFREYLRMLEADFLRLASGLQHETSNRLRWQALFALRVLEVKFQVTLYRFRLAELDVEPLMSVFEALREELTGDTVRMERAPA